MGTLVPIRPQEPMPAAASRATTLPYIPIAFSSIGIGRPASVFAAAAAALSKVSSYRDETDFVLLLCNSSHLAFPIITTEHAGGAAKATNTNTLASYYRQ